MATMPPVWRNIARRPEMAATWSGISWTAALLEGGPAIPTPTPQTRAESPSQLYGLSGGGSEIRKRPTARIAKPSSIGARYPTRRSSSELTTDSNAIPTARTESSEPAASGLSP